MAGVWSGYLSFGLVTLPVRLFSGARGERIGFHMLHASDHVRLKQQMVCPRDGQVVGRRDTVRGYEYAKGDYVVIPEDQIKAAAPASARQLELLQFCRAQDIDPVWFEASFYLVPEAAGERPYGLLLRAMLETGTWAVAQLTMHNREYLSLVRPSALAGVPDSHPGRKRGGLLLHTLFYLDELRVADGFGAVAADPKPAEMKLAVNLIQGLTQPFDPTRFEDHYRKNLEALIATTLEGKPAPAQPTARRLAPVADLMQSLKASLRQSHALRQTPSRRRKTTAHTRQRRRRAA